MYLATTSRAQKPYVVPSLSIEIFSLEGLSWSLFHEGSLLLEESNIDRLINWIDHELDQRSLAKTLKATKLGGGSNLELISHVLDASPYGRSLNRGLLKDRLACQEGEEPTIAHFRHLGNEHYRAKDYRQSFAYYKKALAIAYDPKTDNNMGLAYMALQKSDQALKSFSRCIERSDGLTYRLNRIRVYVIIESYQEALKDLMHISGLYEDCRIWYYYGIVYEMTHRNEEALAAYFKAIESGHKKSLEAFVQLAYNIGEESLVDGCLAPHQVPTWLSIWMRAQKALSSGDDLLYSDLMEEAHEGADEGGKVRLGSQLMGYYLEKGQVIKALAYLQSLENSRTITEEKAQLYRIKMASATGNREAFLEEVNALINKWKGEARKAAIG